MLKGITVSGDLGGGDLARETNEVGEDQEGQGVGRAPGRWLEGEADVQVAVVGEVADVTAGVYAALAGVSGLTLGCGDVGELVSDEVEELLVALNTSCTN